MSWLERLLNVKCCKSGRDEKLTRDFKTLTGPLGIHNAFNPSFYCDENLKIVAFRAIPDGNDGFFSFVSVEDRAGRSIKNISIDLYEELGHVRLNDPKIASRLLKNPHPGW